SEQFLPGYRFINVQVTEPDIFGNPDLVYNEQYITVIAPNNKVETVRIDGVLVDRADFQPIASSGYSYMSVRVNDGVHAVQADTGIGVYVYGYGIANSYGYIGGTNFSPVDFRPP